MSARLFLMPLPYENIAFETDRLHIRAWRTEDAEAAFQIYGDPVVVRYLNGIPEDSIETMADTLGKIITAYSELGLGYGSFPLIEKSTADLIGAVLLKPLPRTEDIDAWRQFRDDPRALPPVHEIEVGWHLRADKQGQGFATEAALAMLDYGFGELDLDEIYAILFRENTKSAAVAARLGMRPLGETDRFYDQTCDLYVLQRPGTNTKNPG